MKRNNNQPNSSKVAEKNHQPSDYKSSSELEAGYAETHEQVSDTWTEGTMEAVIDDVEGKDVKIPRKGYEK